MYLVIVVVFTAPFNNMRTFKIQNLKEKCVFRHCQSNVQQLVPASNHSWMCGSQIVEHSSDNKTVLSSGENLGEATKHLIGSNEKRICWSSFEF